MQMGGNFMHRSKSGLEANRSAELRLDRPAPEVHLNPVMTAAAVHAEATIATNMLRSRRNDAEN